ncbi:MAG: transporter substrate-binding domain-containing protein, partial [Erysipelotrichaceae bacterium]|nr:transporter substrate-binding domain-containing protein [Erysipelotrichaceae bacterium]
PVCASAAESAAEPAAVEVPSDGDVANIVAKGKLVIGITDFEPMDYQENGEWTGFDAEVGKKVAEDLGVKIEFVEIDWDNKIFELNNKSIDCVWNGMTLTDEVKDAMETSRPYCNNAQVVVMKKDVLDTIETVEGLKDLQFAVENGSAGMDAAEENGFSFIAVSTQADTLLEVASGTSDASIIDLLMAGAMIGEKTSYPDLSYKFELTSEEYGVGCRKGSDLAGFINDEFKKFYDDGTLYSIAEQFGVQESLLAQ